MQTSAAEQRLSFVRDFETGQWSMTELCERYRVTRPTGYKWVDRHREVLAPFFISQVLTTEHMVTVGRAEHARGVGNHAKGALRAPAATEGCHHSSGVCVQSHPRASPRG